MSSLAKESFNEKKTCFICFIVEIFSSLILLQLCNCFFLLTFEPYLENISNLSSQSLTAFTYGVVGMDDYPIDVHILRTMKIGFSEPSQFL